MWNEDETFQYFFDNILLLSEANKAGCWTHAEPVPPDRSGRLRLCLHLFLLAHPYPMLLELPHVPEAQRKPQVTCLEPG